MSLQQLYNQAKMIAGLLGGPPDGWTIAECEIVSFDRFEAGGDFGGSIYCTGVGWAWLVDWGPHVVPDGLDGLDGEAIAQGVCPTIAEAAEAAEAVLNNPAECIRLLHELARARSEDAQ